MAATKRKKARTYRKGGDASEQVHVDWQSLLDEMTDESLPAHLGNAFSKFKAGTDGHGYSFMNCVWLFMQGAKGPVGPFSTWKAHNRFPYKNTGLYVLTPYHGYMTKRDKDGNPVLDEKGKPVTIRYIKSFYPKRTAFDYKDTHGEEIQWEELKDDWGLDRALKALGVERVPFNDLDGNTRGYSRKKEMAINPISPSPWHTTFHELGHIVAGHTDEEGVEEYRKHRGRMEFEAEAVAYLVAHELGLEDWDAAESRAYVRTWLKSEQGGYDAEKLARKVFGTAERILKAGREPVKDGEDEEGGG